MKHKNFQVPLLGFVLILMILFICLVKTGCASTLEEIRDSITKEYSYEFGTEMEIIAKKGDVIRVILNENPSGRKELFLLLMDDMFRWWFPMKYGTGGGRGGRHYNSTDNFFGMGFINTLYLNIIESTNDNIKIKVHMDNSEVFQQKRIEIAQNKAKRNNEPDTIDIDERLEGFICLWSEVKYNFAFFDQVPDLDWDEVLEEYLPQIRNATKTEEYYLLLERCIAQLNDGHTTVYPPSRSWAQLPFQLADVNGKPIVAEVAKVALLIEPQLKPGLELTHINGRPISEILENDIYPYVANSTTQNRNRHAFRRLIQLQEGSDAKVHFRGIDGKPLEFTLSCLKWKFAKAPLFEYYELGEDIAYVVLNSFSSSEIISRFKMEFDKISNSKGLIIDVRNNNGGSTSNGYGIISYLINKPLLGSHWKTPQYIAAFKAWEKEQSWYEEDESRIESVEENPYLKPIIVLTGAGTISAAEDFVVALHASNRVTIIGEKTAGTTGQPLLIGLPQGGKARICTKHDMYPDGREFVGVGIIPDIEVYPTQESIAEGKDVVLEKAIEVLAKEVGISKINLSQLSAQITAERQQISNPDEEDREFIRILEESKVIYENLSGAYHSENWEGVNDYGGDLFELLYFELLKAFDVKFNRELLKAQNRLNQQTEFDLQKQEILNKEMKMFFGNDMEKVHVLISEMCELSDDVHDCARDETYDDIPKYFADIEKCWKTFSSYADKKLPGFQE